MEIREQLLAATVRVISEQGSRGATTRRISDAAGVNEVTLFRQFGSKAALIHEAMQWNTSRTPIPAFPSHPENIGKELLAWATGFYSHMYQSRALIRTAFGEFVSQPDVASCSHRVGQEVKRALQQYLEEARDLGLVAGDWDVQAASGMLVGTLFLDAIFRDSSDHTPSFAPEDAPGIYVELFLRAIGQHTCPD